MDYMDNVPNFNYEQDGLLYLEAVSMAIFTRRKLISLVSQSLLDLNVTKTVLEVSTLYMCAWVQTLFRSVRQ